jgi:ABC-type antimicrobial peptide transport system permease subunit
MKKFMKTIWVVVLAVFILLLIGAFFGLNSSLLSSLLGQYVIAPLLLIQIIVWIFFKDKKEA